MKECSHSFAFILAKLDMDDGLLLANDEICATTGSNVKTRTVNKLKMRSKTGKVASVGFKLTKLASRASWMSSSASS